MNIPSLNKRIDDVVVNGKWLLDIRLGPEKSLVPPAIQLEAAKYSVLWDKGELHIVKGNWFDGTVWFKLAFHDHQPHLTFAEQEFKFVPGEGLQPIEMGRKLEVIQVILAETRAHVQAMLRKAT